MEFLYLSIFISLNLALVATHAALPPELYWKSKLPTTQIPKSITDILHPAGKGGTPVDVGKDSVNGKTWRISDTDPFFIYIITYANDATEAELQDKRNLAMFFLEKDLHHGTKMNLQFTKTSHNGASFLPRDVANSIPFSSNKIENIFNYFSIKQGSKESEIVKTTLGYCEMPPIIGEEKDCLTSLESLVDFTTSKLGNNVDIVSTEVNVESGLQQYVITKGVKTIGVNNSIVCHPLNYPYAVFYCHNIDATKVYSVVLEGADGNSVKAIAICHTDTSQWNPKHMAFYVLKIQPGTFSICHFIQPDLVVWLSK